MRAELTGWRKDWRPAGGWKLLAGVLALALGFGVGGVVSYAAVSDAPPPRVIIAPTPHASTSYRYVTIAPRTRAPPTTGLGPASIPAAPYTPTEHPSPTPSPSPTLTPTPTVTQQSPTEVPSTGSPPDTTIPIPGVSTPEGSPS